jgi:lipoyl(octanoyl) transferase
MAVIPSGAENGATGEGATWTGRPKAERAGSERIKSLDSSEEARQVSTSLDMTTRLFGALDVYYDYSADSAALNMAIDEALLENATVPLIRFYRWHFPALSFGYFGRLSDVAGHISARDLVRRWTGGGIVFHGDDLTYSIVIPASDAAFGESPVLIYEKVHRALVEALNGIGEHAVVAGGADPGGSAVAKQAAVNASGHNCFANPVRADVTINGRKIAGAAQRRTHRGLLHQGSIQGIELENGLAKRFAQELSANCSEREINTEVLNRARELAQCKYGTDAWLRKR